MRLVIMGPPGAGKGTQAKAIAEKLQVPAISTGDIFRQNVREETELGLEAKRYLDSGDYVPDAVTNAMVRDRLAETPDGFLLDGYPRTVAQVAELDSMVEEAGERIDAVLVLTVDTDEIVERLRRRAVAEGRSDDTEDVIRHRQEVYAEQTAPLIEEYDERGLLVRVDGMGEVAEVTSRIFEALDATNGAAAS
jgi:adenylate kinase